MLHRQELNLSRRSEEGGGKKEKKITLEKKRRKRRSEERRGKEDKEENEEILNWGKDGLVLDSQNKKTEIIQGFLTCEVTSYPFKGTG